MPELPEVETVRAVLHERLAGRRLESIRVPATTFYRRPDPAALAAVEGRKVAAFERRGKYLLLRAEGGASLALHLGMSGRLFLAGRSPAVPAVDGAIGKAGLDDAAEPGPHCRLELRFEGATLRFLDPRRFGRAGCPLPEPFGPEPLGPGFHEDWLARAFRGRSAPVHALLMDQAVVAGVGNIYSTESLHRAGIRPGRAAGRLAAAERARLVAAVRETLAEGIRLRGCTLDDEAFLDPDGRPGGFQTAVRVYGRDVGLCGHAVRSVRRPVAGRTARYCPSCQR